MIVIKVLVCGSYQGAVQAKLNQRLKKEKHEIFVLTNDSSSQKKTSAVFQDYRFPYESDSIMNVMTSIMPDAVIFCGAQDAVYDWSKGVSESVEYVAGVMNVVSCAVALNVKRFIYLSTLDVFEGNEEKFVTEETIPVPVTQREKSVLQGERISMSSSAKGKAIEVSVIRLPEVYGACGKRASQSICTDIAEAVYSQKSKYAANEELYCLMYLDDAVDAIYKVLTVDSERLHELYHIVPDRLIKEKTVCDIFESIDTKKAGKAEQTADNEKFRSNTQMELGFAEKYSLEEGLQLFFRQYAEVFKSEEKEVNIKKNSKDQRKIFRPVLETIFAFIIVQLFMFLTRDMAFQNVIDVYLVYVLVIAVVLGTVPSTLAVVLSVLGKYYMLFTSSHTLDIFTDYQNYLWLLQIFSLSVLTGYLRDQYLRNSDELKRENDYLKSEIESLKSINDSNVEVKDVFEKRLINYKDSYAKVYDIISKLDDLESKSIVFKAARVVADVMESKDVAIYTYEAQSGFCRLMASTSDFAKSKGKSFRLSEYAAVQKKLLNNEIYMNCSFEENMPMFATGTYSGEKLEVVIMIWSMDLVNVNLHQRNLLTMLSKLMERSMSKALRYMESVRNSTYISETNVMEAEAFHNMLDIYCEGESQGVLEYSLLEVISYDKDVNLYQELSHMTRGTDYLGVDKEGKVYILLTNSSEEDSMWVIRRCAEKGVNTQIVKKNKGKTADEVFTENLF